VVFSPFVQNKSLTAMGAPTKALSNFLLASIFLALLTAFSKSLVLKQFNLSDFSILLT